MRKLLIVILCMVLCIGICGCDEHDNEPKEREGLQEILDKANDRSYNELITETHSLYDWKSFHTNYVYAVPKESIDPESFDPFNIDITKFKVTREPNDDIIAINQNFPIQCLRKIGDTIYSIHAIDEDRLLIIEYEKYNNGFFEDDSLRIKEPSILLPKNVTLTDGDISKIKANESTLSDVAKIDSTAPDAYSIITQRYKSDANQADDFKTFCSKTMFSTVHYTVEGNWYKINYGANGEGFSDIAEWKKTVSSNEIKASHGNGRSPSRMPVPMIDQTKYKVLNIEKIDAPPILEQDLPK